MEIKYPEQHCDCSPNGAHFFERIEIGIWRCKYCLVAKWLPDDYKDAADFAFKIRKYGVQKSYNKLLRKRPEVKERLQELNAEGGSVSE